MPRGCLAQAQGNSINKGCDRQGGQRVSARGRGIMSALLRTGFTLYGGRVVELKRNFKKPPKCLVVGTVGVWEARGKTFSSSSLVFLA